MIINEAMIFAAGFGKRLLPITKSLPKPLIKLKGQSILISIIEKLLDQNFINIVVNAHYLSKKIIMELKRFPNVKIIVEDEILETGGGFLNALKSDVFIDSKSPKLLVNGDIYWEENNYSSVKNLISNWESNSMNILLCLKKREEVMGLEVKGDFGLEKQNKKMFKLVLKEKPDFVFSGLQIVNPEIVMKFKKDVFSMKEVFLKQIKNSKAFGVIDKNSWYHLGTKEDLTKIIEILEVK